MARGFDATDDVVTCALGACGFAFGPGSMAVLVRLGATTPAQHFMSVGLAGNTARYGMNGSGADVFRAHIGTTQITAPTIAITGGAWQVLAVSKATGTVAARFHKYLYSTDAHSHENDDATVANSSAPTTNVYLGTDGTVTVDGLDGDLLIAAVWDVVLSDAQFEALPFSLAAWFAVQPKGLWLLDQDTTAQKVLDLTGGGANETALAGTTIGTASVPVFGYEAPILIPTRAAAAGQTIALGQVTETDLAQAISWAPKRRLLGQVTETDLAQALSGRKTKALGQVTETDLAQALTARKTLVLGQATETDLAQAITRLVAGQTIPLGQVSETDLAQAFGVRKTKALGQVTESDLAQSLTSRKTKALGQVTETDLAQALTRVKTRALGQVTETDLAQALAWAPKHRLLGQVTETDLAQAFSVVGGAVFDPTPVICGTETLTAVTCDTAALSAVTPDSLTLTPSC